jgi:hypothetical protein
LTVDFQAMTKGLEALKRAVFDGRQATAALSVLGGGRNIHSPICIFKPLQG